MMRKKKKDTGEQVVDVVVDPHEGTVINLRLHVFGTVSEELRHALTPPWAEWMRAMYGIRELGSSGTSVVEGRASVSSALSAVGAHMSHHLGALSVLVGVMEELGWHVGLHANTLICTRVGLSAEAARKELEQAGLFGALIPFAELDEVGAPLLGVKGRGESPNGSENRYPARKRSRGGTCTAPGPG